LEYGYDATKAEYGDRGVSRDLHIKLAELHQDLLQIRSVRKAHAILLAVREGYGPIPFPISPFLQRPKQQV